MTFMEVAALGEGIGGFAVLITLLYLAYQMKQTTRIEKSSAQRDILKQARSWFELTLKFPNLFNIIQKGLNDWKSLKPDEQDKCSAWAFSCVFMVEQAFYMQRDGFINDASFRGFEGAIIAIIRTPGGKIWWKYAQNLLGIDVVEHINLSLQNTPESTPTWLHILPHFTNNM